jgi:hypothetical protein
MFPLLFLLLVAIRIIQISSTNSRMNEKKQDFFLFLLLSVGNTENKTVGSLWPAAAMSCCWCVGLLLCPHRDGLPWFDALRNPFEWKKTNSDERSEETREKNPKEFKWNKITIIIIIIIMIRKNEIYKK